ncbi:MAG: hypothetical protein CMK92_05875 [Pseudomonas sp.]|nr:hypothetical protein [Pseudomonas sp.]
MAAAGTHVDFIKNPLHFTKEAEGKSQRCVEFDGKTFETVCAAAVVNAWSYEIDPATGAMFVRIGTNHQFQVLSFSNTLNSLENARIGKNLDETAQDARLYHFCVIKLVVNVGDSIDYPQTKLKDSACALWLAQSPEFDFESLFKKVHSSWSIGLIEESLKESMYASVVWDYKASRNVAEYCDVYFHDCRVNDMMQLQKARDAAMVVNMNLYAQFNAMVANSQEDGLLINNLDNIINKEPHSESSYMKAGPIINEPKVHSDDVKMEQ